MIRVPAKVILVGEHTIVRANKRPSRAIAFPVLAHGNFEIARDNGIVIRNKQFGTFRILIEDEGFVAKGEKEVRRVGDLIFEVDGEEIDVRKRAMEKGICAMALAGETLWLLSKEIGKIDDFQVLVDVAVPKGMGASAIVATGIIKCVLSFFKKDLSRERIVEIARRAEMIAHGGGSSGIDPGTVNCEPGEFLLLEKVWENGLKTRFFYRKGELKGHMLVYDTYPVDRARDTTAELVQLFGRNLGVKNAPYEMDEQDREIVEEKQRPFYELIDLVLEKIERGEWLGSELTELHKLLANYGVSTKSHDRAVEIMLEHGALGAKLSGAGGRGGIGFGIFKGEDDLNRAREALKSEGYGTLIAKPYR